MGITFIRALQELQSPLADEIFRFFTTLASPWFICIGLVFFIRIKGWRLGVTVLLGVLFSLCVNLLLKELIQLDRPYVTFPDVFVFNESGSSFPSGHAQVGMTFWVLFGAFIEHGKKSDYWACFWFCIPILIGISRCYFGVHYPTDVFAGWFMGVFSLVIYLGLFGFIAPDKWKDEV